MKTKLKEEFTMLNALMLIGCIYVALIAASLTMVLVVKSKWFVNMMVKMTKDMMDMVDEDV